MNAVTWLTKSTNTSMLTMKHADLQKLKQSGGRTTYLSMDGGEGGALGPPTIQKKQQRPKK